MKKQVHGHTDGRNSCDRIIGFNSQVHLSAEEKACLTFLEETIESIVTEDDALSTDDARCSGNTIGKKHYITNNVYQGRSSCNSFPVTGSSQDLSAEEKACLQFLEETIDSTEDRGLVTDDAKSLPEFSDIIKPYTNQIKNYLVPTPLVLITNNGNIPPKQDDIY